MLSRPTIIAAGAVAGSFVLLSGIAVALGCRADKPSLITLSSRPASRLFQGFAYAGEQPSSVPDRSHVSSRLPLRLVSQPMPVHFLPGHNYYFHHPRLSEGSIMLASEVLAPRIRGEGFVLTETVNGIFFKGFAYMDERRSGDSYFIWGIQFKGQTCNGEIWHDLDGALERNWWPVVRNTWEPADYILRIEGRCEL